MPAYFWANNTEIPSELITYNFTSAHLAWALPALLLLVPAALGFRRLAPEARGRLLRALALCNLGLELSTWLWAILGGYYSPAYMLPLHLSGLSVFLELAAVWTRRPLLLEFCYCLSLPAALLAILMPGWYYPLLTFRYLASALLHVLLALVPVLLVWGEGLRPSARRLPGCFGLLLACLALAAAGNALFDGNYMFLRSAPRDTLLGLLEARLGHPGYLLASFGVLALLWLLLYLPWTLAARRRRRTAALAR